jgi:hypothetical protein
MAKYYNIILEDGGAVVIPLKNPFPDKRTAELVAIDTLDLRGRNFYLEERIVVPNEYVFEYTYRTRAKQTIIAENKHIARQLFASSLIDPDSLLEITSITSNGRKVE